ncbi:hypothetical protein D3C81_1386450 [compost metagenome]
MGTQTGGFRHPLRGRLGQQVLDADGQDGAVDRCAAAVFTQQAKVSCPFRGINPLVLLISRVAPCGIDENRFVGEPPVGAICAGPRLGGLAHLFRKRELQTGVEQRRGFPCTGHTDHHVPR